MYEFNFINHIPYYKCILFKMSCENAFVCTFYELHKKRLSRASLRYEAINRRLFTNLHQMLMKLDLYGLC